MTHVTGVSVSPTSKSIEIGDSTRLTATIVPSNASNTGVTWSSSNTSVATVSSTGWVTGVANGMARITVTTNDGSKTTTAEITVTGGTCSSTNCGLCGTSSTCANAGCVWNNNTCSSSNEIKVTGVSVSPTSKSIAVGDSTRLTATVLPSDATNKNVSWSSSNTSVATVSSTGWVTGVGEGTATITVTTADGNKTATATITVYARGCYGYAGSQGIGYIYGWNDFDSGREVLPGINEEDCNKYAGWFGSNEFCFKDGNNNYYWGRNYVTSGYIHLSGITEDTKCHAAEAVYKCYCNSTNSSDKACLWRTSGTTTYQFVDETRDTEAKCLQVSNSCNITANTTSKIVSLTESGTVDPNSYYVVTVTVSGLDCPGKKITYSVENGQPARTSDTISTNGTTQTFTLRVYPLKACIPSVLTATLDNGKYDYASVELIKNDWKLTEGCFTITKGTVPESHIEADSHSPDPLDYYYEDWGVCPNDSTKSGYRKRWDRTVSCGGGGVPYTPETYACYANASTLEQATKIGWLTKASRELTYPITTGWFGVSITKDNYAEQCTVCACYADAKTIANATKVKWICNSDSTATTDKKTYTERVRYGIDGTTEITVKNYTSQCVPPSQKYEEPKYCYANAADIKDATMTTMLTVSEYNQKIKDTTFKYRYPIKDANGNQVTNEDYCKPSACYENTSTGAYTWAEVGSLGTGYKKVEIYTSSECKTYAACMAEVDKDGNYKQVVWSTSKSDIDDKLAHNWVEINGITDGNLCHPGACYKKDNDVKWIGTGQDVPTGYNVVDDSECSYVPPKYEEPACYVRTLSDGSAEFKWGLYENTSGYSRINVPEAYCVTSPGCWKNRIDDTYHIGDYSLNLDYDPVSDSYCNISPVPATAFDKSKVMYVAMLFMALAGVGLISYGNLKKNKA